jgi:antitoxin VapB
VATLDVQDLVTIGQVYAWNPSITGTKSEDTILIGQYENEVLTEIEDWPTIDVDIRGNKYSRPAILEIG